MGPCLQRVPRCQRNAAKNKFIVTFSNVLAVQNEEPVILFLSSMTYIIFGFASVRTSAVKYCLKSVDT